MVKVNRIWIKEGKGHCGDPVFPYVHEVMKRTYGNGVIFAIEEEKEDILAELATQGFTAKLDGYIFSIMEPNDYMIGNIINVNGLIGNIPMVIKELDCIEGRKAVKAKYVKYPRKRAVWMFATTAKEFKGEIIKSVGIGCWEKFKDSIFAYCNQEEEATL